MTLEERAKVICSYFFHVITPLACDEQEVLRHLREAVAQAELPDGLIAGHYFIVLEGRVYSYDNGRWVPVAQAIADSVLGALRRDATAGSGGGEKRPIQWAAHQYKCQGCPGAGILSPSFLKSNMQHYCDGLCNLVAEEVRPNAIVEYPPPFCANALDLLDNSSPPSWKPKQVGIVVGDYLGNRWRWDGSAWEKVASEIKPNAIVEKPSVPQAPPGTQMLDRDLTESDEATIAVAVPGSTVKLSDGQLYLFDGKHVWRRCGNHFDSIAFVE